MDLAPEVDHSTESLLPGFARSPFSLAPPHLGKLIHGLGRYTPACEIASGEADVLAAAALDSLRVGVVGEGDVADAALRLADYNQRGVGGGDVPRPTTRSLKSVQYTVP